MNGYRGFISLDISLGCELYIFRGLSATLLAGYRRVIAGGESYGFGQNFIGGRILLNLDFDRNRWK